jgi:hypothetical protein
MKLFFFIGYLCITFTCNCIAQNLVANGDFESFIQCPTQSDQGAAAFPWGSAWLVLKCPFYNS